MSYIIKKSEGMPQWDSVSSMTLVKNDNTPSSYKTIARLSYDDHGIYFRFECQDDKINCTMKGYNQPIYDEETVEFFISSQCDKTRYLELEWNGIGGEFCANVHNDLKGHTQLDFVQNNIIKSQVEHIDGGWSVTGFLPKELFAGKMSGKWLFNAFRIKRNADNSMYLMAYSPTYIDNFHKPDYFVDLIFEEV